MNAQTSRRQFIQKASIIGLATWPLATLAEVKSVKPDTKLKVICVGGHPDDPESGCGGTLARFSAAGHDVHALYLTRGEAGIEGKSHSEAASVRTKEAEEGCKILKIHPHFLGQIDGDTVFNSDWIRKMTEFLQREQPDIVFTH